MPVIVIFEIIIVSVATVIVRRAKNRADAR